MENTPIITKESALQILDKIDAYRRKYVNQRAIPFDYDMRVVAAFVAEAAGFDGRTEWTDALKKNPDSQYAKDYTDIIKSRLF